MGNAAAMLHQIGCQRFKFRSGMCGTGTGGHFIQRVENSCAVIFELDIDGVIAAMKEIIAKKVAL